MNTDTKVIYCVVILFCLFLAVIGYRGYTYKQEDVVGRKTGSAYVGPGWDEKWFIPKHMKNDEERVREIKSFGNKDDKQPDKVEPSNADKSKKETK